jgi:ATP-binding cassette, subfamily B, bacterial CvaB/MchF/RaxB
MNGRENLQVVRQATATECGLACVAMIATYHGVSTDLASLRRKHEVSLKGATLAGIASCCTELGLSTRAVRCDVHELKNLRTPCILHWRFNHFVVLRSVKEDRIVVHDPARGVVSEPLAVVSDAFTGIALELSSVVRFRRAKSLLRLKLRDLVSSDSRLRRQFLAGLLLALICEILLLTTPFYLQIVIDQVLAKGDSRLLISLATAFSILLVINVLANIMRQLTFHYLSHVAVFDITTRVLHRLLQLPIRFFRSRELGDIQHRVQSLRHIQSFVVQSIPALILDSVFVVLITGLMTLYEPGLTLLMLVALGLWCCWRILIFSLSLRLSSDIAQAESSVQTHFLETLRAVQSIKVTNGEAQRESEWRNLFVNATNTRIRAGNLHVVDNAVRQVLFHGARIVTVYLLALRSLDGQISIGMISAYVAYLGMFTTRGCGIVDRVLEYKLLEVPLGRLADIVFSEEESCDSAGSNRPLGDIELRHVSFSYSSNEPDILKNCSVCIRESGMTAIAGPSGVGKSTLLQIVAGHERISGGELLIGGRPAHHWRPHDLRSQLAVVFQDDRLLKGSVAENIALFDSFLDMARIQSAAVAACIADDIEALPMAYETRIGDLGSSLSRGQVQRILLARAYYRRPALLLLDEATSGLDYELEKEVISGLRELPATKLVVTHSDLMLQAADTVLWLHDGRLLLSRPDLNV